MLQQALEEEVNTFLAEHAEVRDECSRRLVVRNGRVPAREILTGAGAVAVRQPRVRDRRRDPDERVQFSSSILPPYLRRAKNLDELIPWLYLRGISTGDFQPALEALLGENAKGLSPNVIVRLKEKWFQELEEWNRRDLSQTEYVYVWADGVYFNIRLEDERQCILVLMGATADGTKELVAIQDGFRESEQSWGELMSDVKRRGLTVAPKLAVGDGALGFWAALRKMFPSTREQRCWVHKTANILNKIPKSVQPRAKSDLHEIWQAPTRRVAEDAFDAFLEKYGAKYAGATNCLEKDRDELLAFYDFPAEHWIHLRTTNPIESVFATVRLRHRRTKGSGTRTACLAMVFKLIQTAQKKWRRLHGAKLLLKVIKGIKFVDGVEDKSAA
jgi:transposase-like protein